MTLPDALTLPDGWRTVPLELIGDAPGIELVAAHETPDAGFTANITVGVQDSAGPGYVEALGDAAVRRIEATEQDVTVRRREVLAEEPTPALVQEVVLTTDLGGTPVTLVQTQAFLAATDPERPGQALVRTVTCTATAGQAEALAEDVAALVRALREGDGAAG